MGRFTFYTVLALLVLQCSATSFQRVWQYNGDVRVTNVASEDLAAVWGIDAKVTAQKVGDKIYVKFENVKTALVNGYVGLAARRHYKDIPKESEAVLKPFVVDISDPTNVTILHESDDPVWSVNLKRGVTTAFLPTLTGDEKEVETEQTLYGRCKVTNVKSEKDGNAIVKKIIHHNDCEESPSFDFGVKGWDPTGNEHNPITVNTTYEYFYNGTAEPVHLNLVKTDSVMEYKSMPDVRSVQKIEQNKHLALVELTTDDSFPKIDVSKATVVANITFDYSKGPKGDRDTTNPKKTAQEQIAEYNKEYLLFKEHFDKVPLLNSVNNITVFSMHDALYQMNKDTLHELAKEVIASDDNLYQHLFLGHLTYLGTEDSARFIKELIENEDEGVNDLLAIKILSTFPVYFSEYSEQIVQDLEGLMTLKASNPQVKYAGILGFATLVSDSASVLEKATFEKYANLYYKNFVDAKEYEEKLTYLSGLINLKNKLSVETMIELCVNKEISHHLRAFAFYGFKPALKTHPEEVYKSFWPIVKDDTQHYEVRVAALDSLLYSGLSYDQFQTIVQWYHEHFRNPEDQHLANYLYTTVQALEKTTGYFEPLGEFADEAIESMKPIKSNRVWTTGNYRVAFTDEAANLGGSLQARLIANPDSNLINVGIFSIDTFAVSMNLGSYTAYVKIQGVPDVAFIFGYLNSRDTEGPINHLLELIKKHGYKIKDFEGAHVEVVIFSDDRVVFGMYIDKDNIDNYSENPLFLDLVKLALGYGSLSFPMEESSYIVSDLGTSIDITHYMSDVASYELENLDKLFAAIADDSSEVDALEYNTKYRSQWTYSLFTSCYNPLAEASAETYKYIKDEKYINIPYSFNLTDYVFKWKHTKDSFNWIQDHMLGVYVDEDRLEEYCVDHCESVIDLPIGELTEKPRVKSTIEALLGVHFNVTVSAKSDIEEELEKGSPPALLQVLATHQTNSHNVPFITPVLYAWHAALYNTFIDKDLYSISVRTEPYWNEPTEMVFDLDMDVNDIKNDKDPIGGEEFDFTIGFTNRKSQDAEVLTYFNATVNYKTKSEVPDGEAQPHIEHKYDVNLFFDIGEEKKFKVCIDREVLYPNRRVDKFSLDPVDPTKGTTKIVFGTVQKITDECPSKEPVTITEIYTATQKQKQNLESMEEYGKCKKDIDEHKHKYVPPIDDCLEAHSAISKYDACDVYIDMTQIEGMPIDLVKAHTSEFGMKVLEYKRLNNTHVSVNFVQDFADQFVMALPEDLKEKTQIIEDDDHDSIMSLSPSVVAYDDHDLEIGASSACYITPKQIITFHEKVIPEYQTKFGPDTVAFVECLNDTQSGLTVQKVGDNKIGFNFWSENNTLVASASDGKVKVVFNGKPITETTVENEDFKIYFLDQDVIYVTNGLVDIQYTTEYISIKALSIYNNYICGLCAGDTK